MMTDKEQIFKLVLIITSVLGSLYVLSPFLPVILLAGVIAFALDPLLIRIRRSKWSGRSSCIYALTFGLFLLITVPFLTILVKFYDLLLSIDLSTEGRKAALESFNQHRMQLSESLTNLFSQLGLRKSLNVDAILGDGAQQIFNAIFKISTYAVTQIPVVLFSFAVFIVTLFLFLRHREWFRRTFYMAHLMNIRDSKRVVRVLKETSYSSLFSSLITGVLQSSIVTIGAMIFLDIDNLLVFTLTFFCSFIPVIGAAPIAFALAVYAWMAVSPGAALGLVGIGAVAGIADNVIRVVLLKVVKDDLHPFCSLLAIIGGILVLGLPGLFLGPVIVSATTQVVPILLGKSTFICGK